VAVSWWPGTIAMAVNGKEAQSLAVSAIPVLQQMRLVTPGSIAVERMALRPFRTPLTDLRTLTRQGAIA
jgi:hypothetical protein